jgi:hypothetical protein
MVNYSGLRRKRSQPSRGGIKEIDGGTEENYDDLRIVGFPVDIPTKNFPNTSVEILPLHQSAIVV